MNEDFSEAIAKFKNILEEKNIEMPKLSQSTGSNDNSSEKSGGFDFDINTILKLKSIIGSAQEKNSPRIQLLNALKPFLQKEKQQKLEEYIKIANVITILEIFRRKSEVIYLEENLDSLIIICLIFILLKEKNVDYILLFILGRMLVLNKK